MTCLLPLSCLSSLEQFCDPGVAIPDGLIKCGTCKNRCGTIINPDHFQCPDREIKHLCSCDKFCKFHGDCCNDFKSSCSDEFKTYQDILQKYPSKQRPDDFICQTFKTVGNVNFQYLVIHTCSDGSQCVFTSTMNDDITTFVPVYDIHRGIHYISEQCAICNGIMDIISWNVIADCFWKVQ